MNKYSISQFAVNAWFADTYPLTGARLQPYTSYVCLFVFICDE